MAFKPLPIGVENFEKIITHDYYYVDKTLFIKELIDKKGDVNLFTRPRRFGKTLSLSMLKYFFEDSEYETISAIKDKVWLFNHLKIMQAGDKYLSHMGKYPVINLSLKAAKRPTFEGAYVQLRTEIANEFFRHRYVLQKDCLSEHQKEKYNNLMNEKGGAEDYAESIKFLSEALHQYHEVKTIILIDEYDVPLENAYFSGFYDQMIGFIRSLFESALKTNNALEFAVITGCLRISKESIFTGLNNLEINSILSENYGEYFGFTQAEVDQMLDFYGRSNKSELTKSWYNGYRFGQAEVYNPWSAIKFIQDLVANENAFARPYWVNTSSNSIIRTLIEKAEDPEIKQEIENLIAGKTIEKPVHEEIIYADIDKTPDNLWNFLFFTGYLKKVSERQDKREIYLGLKIPNEEILYIYENTIREWFQQKIQLADLSVLHQAVLSGNDEVFTTELNKYLLENISYYDSSESLYHGFLLGLLTRIRNYGLRSNREAGKGRYDIIIKPRGGRELAIILELKVAPRYAELEKYCNIALEQINAQNYEAELREDCYKKILKYGIAFNKKDCLVKLG